MLDIMPTVCSGSHSVSYITLALRDMKVDVTMLQGVKVPVWAVFPLTLLVIVTTVLRYAQPVIPGPCDVYYHMTLLIVASVTYWIVTIYSIDNSY